MSVVKIQNVYLDDVTWRDASGCGFVVKNTADVWRISIADNLPQLGRFSAIINADEAARADRYFHQKDTHRFIISRAVLRIILGRYLNRQPAAIEFVTGPNKKPQLKDQRNTPLFYNVSHSGNWIVIAVCDTETGIDTEFADPAFDYKEIIQDNFSPPEIEFITRSNTFESFFRLWTRKEALTKATAKGLDDDLKLIPCLDGIHNVEHNIIGSANDWQVITCKVDHQYLASVACSGNVEDVRFWEMGIL